MDWVGKTLGGRYLVEALLGEGAMGVVLRAVDMRLGQKRVAVKVLKPSLTDNPRVRERFVREALAQANIEHPGIVRATDVVDESGALAIVLDYVEGESLADLLARSGGRLTLSDAWQILRPVAEAVQKAHDSAVVHRDLKPANVLLGVSDGGVPVPKVADFGIAKLLVDTGGESTLFGTVMGTPAYMPPEQLRGELDIDARADVYALGVMAYQMLTGNLPYGSGEQVPQAISSGHRPASPSQVVVGLPERIDDVVLRAMALQRNARYASVKAFAADLASVIEGREPAASAVPGVAAAAGARGGAASPTVFEPTQPLAPEPATTGSPGKGSRGRLIPAVAVGLVIVALGGYYVVRASGTAYPRCTSDADCKGGEACLDGKCAASARQCTAHADCPGGDLCLGGRCAAATAAPAATSVHTAAPPRLAAPAAESTAPAAAVPPAPPAPDPAESAAAVACRLARSSDTLAAWRSVLTSHPGADCAARALERARDLEVREQAETVRPAERPAPPVPTVLSGVRAAASKAIPDYPASHLADGNLSTAWQTHFKDTAFIDIDLGDTATVSRVSIANGYQKFSENYGDLLPKNARIAAATLLFDDGSRVPMRLKALSRGYEEVTFSPRKSRILRIEIDSIHRGDTYKTDLCVSEIRVYGSR